MPKRQKMTRIALEPNEADYREMQQGLDAFNAVFAPLRLSRSDLLRAALREKLAAMQRQQYVVYRPAEADKIQREIDQLKATIPAAPPPAAMVSAPTERSTPRPAGYVLTGIGAASLLTGATLLGAMTTVSDDSQRRAMLASGSVLLALGVIELAGGITIITRKRPQAAVALRTTGSGFLLVGRF